MPTDAEIDTALDAVIVAARAHRALLRAGERASERDVSRAYVALNNATVRYDDLLSETYDEVTPWDVELLESDDAGEEPAAPDYPPARLGVALADSGSALICVRQRRDYQVPDIAALIRLGTEVRAKNWSEHDPEHGSTPVTNLGEAVYELVLAGDGTLASLDAYSQLVPGNGVLLVNALEHGLRVVEAAQGEEDEPFRLTPSDPLLYRLDEEVIEDGETDSDTDSEIDWDTESDVDEDDWDNERVPVSADNDRGGGSSNGVRG
jgi:hypothetical protein